MKIPVFLALLLTVFAQTSVAIRNDNSVQCNAMAGNLLRQIKNPSALKVKPEYILEMQKIFATTLDYQLQSGMNELESIANANVPYLNSVETKRAIQTIKDKGIIGMWSIRVKRVYEFGYTYDENIFSLAKATIKNPTWDVIIEAQVDFSVRISRFCKKTLGAMNSINTKTIDDIQPFVKRSNDNFMINDECATMAAEIFQQLRTSGVWDAPTKEAVRLFHLRRVGPAHHKTKTAVENAFDDFRHYRGGPEKIEELRVIKDMDTIAIDAYLDIDKAAFMEHFEPRLQAIFLQPNTAASIEKDIGTICRGALEDYQQILEQSKTEMKQILPTL